MRIYIVIAGCGAYLAVAAVKWRRNKALIKAEARYRRSLHALSVNCKGNQRRDDLLERGRHFAKLARKQAGRNGVAVFNEAELEQDFKACFGSVPVL